MTLIAMIIMFIALMVTLKPFATVNPMAWKSFFPPLPEGENLCPLTDMHDRGRSLDSSNMLHLRQYNAMYCSEQPDELPCQHVDSHTHSL